MRSAGTAAEQVAQAQRALADAQSRMDETQQQLRSAFPELVARQDWEALSGQLHKAEMDRRDRRITLINKIIEVILDLETLYGPIIHQHTRSQRRACRQVRDGHPHDGESVGKHLQTEFNLERIPIQRYTVFDARCMEPDGHVEDPLSRNSWRRCANH